MESIANQKQSDLSDDELPHTTDCDISTWLERTKMLEKPIPSQMNMRR